MRLEEINIRDPFIMLDNDSYYLYGTRGQTCWGKADGFDCYKSSDLESWEGPIEIFHRPEGFEMDQNYWAPECYKKGDSYYLLTTFGSEKTKKGIYVLKSDKPEGPFEIYSDRLTPQDWTCIDATLYFEGNHTYMVYSHSFEDGNYDGDICMQEVSEDLTKNITEPVVLISAAQAPWPKPFPFAKEEFGIDQPVYFTDGPFLLKDDQGILHMYWSSWCTKGYAVGETVSENGQISGPWSHRDKLIFPEDGGHGMAFLTKEGQLLYTLHNPNEKGKEHPIFINLE